MADEKVPDPDKTVETLLGLLSKGDDGESQLASSWRFLQVYAYWGVRMPNSEAHLKKALCTETPGQFGFFALMLETYQIFHDQGQRFLSDIYPMVMRVGENLKSFAMDATPRGDAMFSEVLRALDEGDKGAAMELLKILEDEADRNAEHAGEVTRELSGFKSALVAAIEKLKLVDGQVEADAQTSQATLDRIAAESGVAGSLKNLKMLKEQAQARYDTNVKIAATTPTYGWFWPFGLIAAIVVAGKYGADAVTEINAINDLERQIRDASDELTTANAVHSVQTLADRGLHQADDFTKSAIGHTKIVQTAWEASAGDIRRIRDKLAKAKAASGEEARQVRFVEIFLKSAEKAYAKLLPLLEDLMANPFIDVSTEEPTISDFAEQVAKDCQDPGNQA